ncbi:MAG: SDR family oxidoreductase [Deltaproteobacteria bacterium]|nr:SDR family oxidoreductase [Deltaproteobacteria bacterium]
MPNSEKKLAGKIAIITGGARGIGAATAELFISEGAKVIITSRTSSELGEASLRLQKEFGEDKIFSVVTDVSREKDVLNLFDATEKKFGTPSILINNAAIFIGKSVTEMSVSEWDETMAVNVRGSFLCARESFKRMKPGGAIVNISSLAGVRGTDKFLNFTAYTTSKFGVVGMTENLAVEGKALGIRVNCVAPGAVETEMLRKAAPGLKTQTKPSDIAKVILTLCDDKESKNVTGSVIELFTNV